MSTKKALLIIDMQKGSFTQTNPRFDAEGVVKRINTLAEKFRQNNLPVIFIQHDGSKEKEFVPHTSDWELLSDLHVNESDILIGKTANDVFYNSNLASKLKELDVNALYISGCATDFCVESTIQSALAKDYNITVIANAHTTADRPHLKAEKVIEHYNWVWQNMIPTEGTIKVIDFEQIENLD
jgi:nicotinamidase-related amidase